MTFDHRHGQGAGGGSMVFIVNVSSDRKFYRRSSNSGLLIPLYLTILHLCLFIHNGEALQKDSQYQDPIAMVASLSAKTHESKTSGLSLGDSRLLKRSVPAQSASSEEAAKVTDSSSVKSAESASSSLSTPADVKESIRKSDRQATFLTESATEEPEKTGAPVPIKAGPAIAGAVNGTAKVKASNETKDSAASDDEELGHGLPSGLKPDAVLRLFYVFVVVGVIVLLYLLIKFVRFRRKRATRKYRVLAHSDEQEMFPLAADDGDDEEIFNAADHQTHK